MGAAAYTLPLFDRAPMLRDRPRSEPEAPSGRASDPDGLRPYQREAVTRIHEQLKAQRSTLLVMATGTGKTQTFGAVAKHWGGRVLVLAHRDELIEQARSRCAKMTGEYIGVEQAERHAQAERIVVASVQTLCRESRLKRFQPDRFGLVIVDEAHHAVASTYRRILDHFEAAKVLGVTATPDRGDERAMEQVFDSVAFQYEIEDGIREKYLCPVVWRPVPISSVDLSGIKTLAGDFNQGQLDAVMSSEGPLHGLAKAAIDLAGNRRAIVFTTSVDNAHRLAEVFNRYRPGAARSVDGGTSCDTRRDILRGHKAGEYQYLVNVGVLTEGYDDPGVACIVDGAPTKSRALCAQRIGRGLRPAPGKTDCLVLDVEAGNCGRHALVSALDILGGKWDDEVIARAKKDATKGPAVEAGEALRRAKKDIDRETEEKRAAAARARIKANVTYSVGAAVDPFRVLGFGDAGQDDDGGHPQPATPGQVTTLQKFGIDVPQGLTRAGASKLIARAIMRKTKGLASYKQIKTLSRYAVDAKRMYMSTASRVIDAIAANGWRDIGAAEVSRIVNSREMGED